MHRIFFYFANTEITLPPIMSIITFFARKFLQHIRELQGNTNYTQKKSSRQNTSQNLRIFRSQKLISNQFFTFCQTTDKMYNWYHVCILNIFLAIITRAWLFLCNIDLFPVIFHNFQSIKNPYAQISFSRSFARKKMIG